MAERDALRVKWNIYEVLITEGITRQDRYSKSEVRFITTVNLAEIQKQADDIARQYRQLDYEIQAKNWQEELR